MQVPRWQFDIISDFFLSGWILHLKPVYGSFPAVHQNTRPARSACHAKHSKKTIHQVHAQHEELAYAKAAHGSK